MHEKHALAPLPQKAIDNWHRFVATADHELAGLAAVGPYCVSFAGRAIARFQVARRHIWMRNRIGAKLIRLKQAGG